MPVLNYDWDDVEDNIVEEYDEAGVTVAEYTSEPDLYGNVISQNRGGVESQFHFDALGSTLAVTGDNQNVTDTRAYSGFGESTESTGGTTFPFQYRGQRACYYDSITGEYTVRKAVFEPTIGRWLSLSDPSVVLALRQEPRDEPQDPFDLILPLLGPVTGVCGTHSATLSGSATSIISIDLHRVPLGVAEGAVLAALKLLGFEPAILREVNKNLPRPLINSAARRRCADDRSKCCVVISQTINLTAFVRLTGRGKVSATITVFYVTWTVSTTFTAKVVAQLTGKAIVEAGICIPKDCKCPPQLPPLTSTLTIGSQSSPIAMPIPIDAGDVQLGN